MTLPAILLAAVAALPPSLGPYVRSYEPAEKSEQATIHYQGQGLSVSSPRTYAALMRVDAPDVRSCGFVSVNIDTPTGRAWASLFVRNQERAAGQWAPCLSAQFWNLAGNPNHHHNRVWDFFDVHPKGAWHHVAVVATSRRVRYYFDGEVVSDYSLQTPAGKADALAEVTFNYDGHGVSSERVVIDAALDDAAVKSYAAAVLSLANYREMMKK